MARRSIEARQETAAERVYSLDALRALMMLLGIVIHASLTYSTMDYGASWPIKDMKSTNAFFDITIAFVHAFRMPVFMVASGYFGALLFFRKGSRAMIRNRINRILLPFVASVLIVYPFTYFAFVYSNSAIIGRDNPMSEAVSAIVSGSFLPYKTAHLWFLYYLFFFSVSGWIIAHCFARVPALVTRIDCLFKKIIEKHWSRLCCVGVSFFACLYWMGTEYVITNNTFSIEPAVFAIYFIFYGIGWMLYQTDSLKVLASRPIVQILAATALFLFRMFFTWAEDPQMLLLKQVLAAMYSTLFLFGILALFLTYFHAYSSRLNYIMASAYWVYIIHLPLVVLFTGLLAGAQLSAWVKFMLVMAGTSAIAFTSYHYLVRGTLIGMFLNGKA